MGKVSSTNLGTGGEWSDSRSSRFNPKCVLPVPIGKRLGGPHKRDGEEVLFRPRIEPLSSSL